MRIYQKISVASLLLPVAIATANRAVPDFSGHWTIEPPSGAAAGRVGAAVSRGDMGSGWGSALTIVQDSSRLTVEYAFFGRGDMQPALKFVYALDGSETRNSVMMGRGVQQQVSRTRWEGDSLLITTIHTFTNPGNGKPMTQQVTQKLSLNSPASLEVQTIRSGVLGGPSSTTTTIYKKS